MRSSEGVRTLLCTEHGMLQPELRPDEINSFIADRSNLLWLDIDTTGSADLGLLDREFGFHELAIEDALRHHQRAKVDQYDSFTFLVFYAVDHDTSVMQGTRLIQIAMFVGPNYLVTVHKGPLVEIDESAARWRRNIDKIDRSISSLIYSLLDAIVDGYFPVIDAVADRVEDIEEAVFEEFQEDALQDIFRLKKSLLAMRRVVAPERDVLNTLIRRDSPLFGPESVPYFQDVYDHLVRVTDSIDIYRDLLTSALDAFLSMSSNRLNQVMKVLASWTIPLMAGALIAGIYGMNFAHMPELDWRLGYPAALLVMTVTMIAIVLYFHRKKWL